MQTTLFDVTYYDDNNVALFWNYVEAESYCDACDKALAYLVPGIADFDIADPEADTGGDLLRRIPYRVTHLRKLQNLAQRKAHPKVPTTVKPADERQEPITFSAASALLLFDCFVDDEGAAAAYRLSSKSAFVGTIGDTLETIIATALRVRPSTRHRHLFGIDPTNGNVVVRLDLGTGIGTPSAAHLQ